MVTVGGDSHKLANTVVAVDENGRQLGETTVAATPTGHMEALGWGAPNGPSGDGIPRPNRDLRRGLQAPAPRPLRALHRPSCGGRLT